MGSHDHIGDHLYAFLDDALDIPHTLHIRAHLETCPACFQRYQFVLNVRHLLREEAANFTAPPHLEERLRQLGNRKPKRPRQLPWRPLPLTVVAILFLLILVTLFFHTSREPELVPLLLAQHRTVLDAQQPLQLRTTNPEEVMAWLKDQIQIPINLPRAALAGFTLVGATTLALPGGKGAYVLYKRQANSLAYVVLATGHASLPAGRRVTLGRQLLTIHREGGYIVGFWTVAEQTYALIAQADEREFLEYVALCVRLTSRKR